MGAPAVERVAQYMLRGGEGIAAAGAAWGRPAHVEGGRQGEAVGVGGGVGGSHERPTRLHAIKCRPPYASTRTPAPAARSV